MNRFAAAAALVAAAVPLAALAAPDGWHRNLDDGLKAARRSGKPVLVATAWTNEQ